MGKIGTVLFIILVVGWLVAPDQTQHIIESLFTALANRADDAAKASTTP